MSETLVIRLGTATNPPVDGPAEWAVIDETGACVLAPSSGPLPAAATLAAGRRVLVLVPATQVLRARADIPVRGTNRISQALPFALEDVVADDVEDLHFSGGSRLDDGQVAVAVTRRSNMNGWLQQLQDAGIHAQGMYADSDGLAEVTGTTMLLLEDGQAILREPGGDPIVSETDGLRELLELWLSQPRPVSTDGVARPRNLQVYDATTEGVSNADWESIQDRLDALEVRRLPDGALARLAAGISVSRGVSLLQGDFAIRSSLVSQWPRWRLAASLVAAVAVSAVAVTAADAWRLRRESLALEAELRDAARYTFPRAGDGADLRALVDAAAGGKSADSAAGSGSQFLDTLRIVSAAVQKSENASIETLNYRSGVMDLQLRAPSAETLDSIRKQVSEGGRLKAEIQSSNAVGDQIQGRIRITGGGA